jgi:hypothetical protein
VSDRLVSGGVKDPIANKNIIYFARGAIVTIGYTGLAYEISTSDRNIPTDEWIAGKLYGNPIPRGPDGIRPVGISPGGAGKWLDIGQSVQLLREELEKNLTRLPLSRRKLPFEIIIAGWQIDRRLRLQPIIISITKEEGANIPVVIKRPQRYWYFPNKIALDNTPEGYLVKNKAIQVLDKLYRAKIDESEDFLVNTVREVSSNNPTSVGANCISILLPPPTLFPIRIRFLPAIPHIATFTRNNLKSYIPVAFTPWIISPWLVCSPSVMVGSSYLQVGPHKIIIEAPTPKKGLLGFMGSLHRPPAP